MLGKGSPKATTEEEAKEEEKEDDVEDFETEGKQQFIPKRFLFSPRQC
jgi:hypothetical protein